mmetsp:Transcript_26410/g.36836  ORF Transcript_26410/g.36836 Transcript_26410/m.36836 type:complete len:360 (-) Transcript_26410:155-1234(-)
MEDGKARIIGGGKEQRQKPEGLFDSKARVYCKPEKKIKNPMQMMEFKNSMTHSKLLGFIQTISEGIQGKGLSDVSESDAPDVIRKLCTALDSMKGWLKDYPPIQQPMRFGNKAFRSWHKHTEERITPLVENILGKGFSKNGATDEIAEYLLCSFGNPTRLDYGTGHELNFLAFLLCLAELKLLDAKEHAPYIAFVAFQRYILLMRELQTLYWLEPAGSKGVWGLDDYNFLPLLLGAAQHVTGRGASSLTKLQEISPSDIHKDEVKCDIEKESMYFQAVAFACKVKTGHLAEHSPILNDISGIQTWRKVHSGLIKMYTGEVLAKFPIMQHFLFGTLLTLDPAAAKKRAPIMGLKVHRNES